MIDDSLLRDPPYDDAPIDDPGSEALLATLIMLAMDRGSLFIDDAPIDDPGSEALLAILIMLMDLGSLFTDPGSLFTYPGSLFIEDEPTEPPYRGGGLGMERMDNLLESTDMEVGILACEGVLAE